MSTAITIRPLSGIATAFAQFRSARDTIQDVTTSDPFGPLQPVKPWVEIDEPRGWQFAPGQNLMFTPRAQQQYSAVELQSLSMYPMARILIENVKDMVCRMPWQIRPRPQEGETSKALNQRRAGDKNVIALTKFFERPNPDQSWSEFIRQPLEDMLTIDAPAILMRRNKKQIVELRPIQGDTLNRLIDKNGFTPQPPDPAYQQLWYGQPMLNLTTDDLCYKPRNILPRDLYGTSPVCQSAQWLEVGIMRLAWQKNYYSASSIPDRVMVVPPGISPDKIAEQQMWMNSALAGNLWSRRQWKLIQGFSTDGHDQIIDAKEGALTDPFDDLLIRVLCYAFGTSPQRLLKMQNRATATSNQEAAEDEGLQPWLDWLRGVINWIIQLKMGFADYEFTFTPPQENDVLKQAQVHKIYLDSGVMVRSEVRDDIGLDPIDLPEMDEPGVFSPQNGFMPISGGIIVNGAGIGGSKQGPVGSEVPDEPPQPKVLPQNANGNQPSNPNEPQPPKGSKKPKAKPGSKDEGDTGKAAHCRTHAEHNGECNACLKADMNRIFKASGVAKAASLKRIKIDPTYSTPEIVKARSDMHALMLRIFHNQKEKASELAGRLLLKVKKAEQNPDDIADEIFDAIYGEFKDVPEEAIAYLRAAALAGAGKGISELGITDEDLIAKVNKGARDWAEGRAAEMVGMRRTDDGKLIPNPNAEWVISEETRDQIRKIVRDAFDDETKMQGIQQSIKEAGMFGDDRAEMVARTEVQTAQTNANYNVWQESGLVKELTWELSDQHEEECPCEDSDGETVPLGTLFSAGVLMPPAHPNCVSGDTIIASIDGVSSYFKRWFHGEVCVIKCLDGTDLTITPNHNVLTRRGWIPAGQLTLSDEIVKCSDSSRESDVWSIGFNGPYDNLMPAFAKKIFSARLEDSSMFSMRVPVSPEDFHGDVVSDGEVEIIRANCSLSHILQTISHEHIGEREFMPAQNRRMFLNPNSAKTKLGKGSLTPTYGVMSSGSIGRSLLGSECGIHEEFSLMLTTNRQSETMESRPESSMMDVEFSANGSTRHPCHILGVRGSNSVIVENENVSSFGAPIFNALASAFDGQTNTSELFNDGLPTRSGNASDILKRLASHVTFMPLLDITRRELVGHVYNLETLSGFYFANGMIVHNCECSVYASSIKGESL